MNPTQKIEAAAREYIKKSLNYGDCELGIENAYTSGANFGVDLMQIHKHHADIFQMENASLLNQLAVAQEDIAMLKNANADLQLLGGAHYELQKVFYLDSKLATAQEENKSLRKQILDFQARYNAAVDENKIIEADLIARGELIALIQKENEKLREASEYQTAIGDVCCWLRAEGILVLADQIIKRFGETKEKE